MFSKNSSESDSSDTLQTFCEECKGLCLLYLKIGVMFIIMIPTLFVAASTGNVIVVFIVFAVIVFIVWICLYWRRMSQTLEDINRQSTDNSENNSIHNNHLNSHEIRPQSDVSLNLSDLPPKYELPPSYSQAIYSIDIWHKSFYHQKYICKCLAQIPI